MTKKLNLGLLFGGRSCEHEVSVTSARSVLQAISRDRYNVYLIGIDKLGQWHLASTIDALVDGKEVLLAHSTANSVVRLDLHNAGNLTSAPTNKRLANKQPDAGIALPQLDLIFSLLHGTFGEDGSIQGVLEMAGIAYVGCGVAASSIAMDKALAKQVFCAASIPQARSNIVARLQWDKAQGAVLDSAQQSLGLPAFVKPANMGSSVGVSKAHDRQSLRAAIDLAFEYDNKIIIEQSMQNCHEVECAVLGNQNPRASVVGEILPGAEFYDYQTKYIDGNTETLIPANISTAAANRVQQLSLKAFNAIDGAGLSRVDFFVGRDTGEVFLNEINTMPGFTPISMYPQLWAASGIGYADLIDQLVQLALAQHAAKATLKRVF